MYQNVPGKMGSVCQQTASSRNKGGSRGEPCLDYGASTVRGCFLLSKIGFTGLP